MVMKSGGRALFELSVPHYLREDLLRTFIRRASPSDDLIGANQRQWRFIQVAQSILGNSHDAKIHLDRLSRALKLVCRRRIGAKRKQCPLRVKQIEQRLTIFKPNVGGPTAWTRGGDIFVRFIGRQDSTIVNNDRRFLVAPPKGYPGNIELKARMSIEVL